MEVSEQIKQLEAARKKAKKLRLIIQALRQSVIAAGGNPDTWKPDNVERNKEFYRKWKGGNKYSEIAKEHGVSATTVGATCRRIEIMLQMKRGKYKLYKNWRGTSRNN
jgi:Mor family transcriptional regulator